MIKHSTTIQIAAPTKAVAEQKKAHLQQLSALPTDVLQILANKSTKRGIADKLKKFQHLI